MALSLNRLIPWWTYMYDQPRISILHVYSSQPVEQSYCIRNSSWVFVLDLHEKQPGLPTEGQEWPRMHVRWQYEYAILRLGCTTSWPHRGCATIVLNSSKHSWSFPNHQESPGIMTEHSTEPYHDLPGFTRMRQDLWNCSESSSEIGTVWLRL